MRCSSTSLPIWPVLRCQVAASVSLDSETLCEEGKAVEKAVGRVIDVRDDIGIDSRSWTAIVVKASQRSSFSESSESLERPELMNNVSDASIIA